MSDTVCMSSKSREVKFIISKNFEPPPKVDQSFPIKPLLQKFIQLTPPDPLLLKIVETHSLKMLWQFLRDQNSLVANPIQVVSPSSANPTKWSHTLKQFVSKFPTNCLSVFDHFLKLALKGLVYY